MLGAEPLINEWAWWLYQDAPKENREQMFATRRAFATIRQDC
jgi:hypothetical protein